ncbi:cupredoxin domain-containing protein [Pararhodobacter zhoushanensis]|uniref:cupredoxin domain-containing protein n=1 Tax=Pararhodobacter zhoushanensis TaxID=2479545 RepID=UPI001C70A45A|nr:cupredoxin family copper-binding protein [Pararhodobacter zhoushanensis]
MTTMTRRSTLALFAATPLAFALAGRAHAATHDIAIEGMAYSPAEITIARGDSITFTNNDSMPHTATFRSAGMDTGRLSQGQTATLTFANAGTFDYFCAVHPSMRARVIVAG